MLSSNRNHIRNCADNILNDFQNVKKQIELLKELRNIADSMVAAEERVSVEKSTVDLASKAVTKLYQTWQDDSSQFDLQKLKEVHASALKKAMDDKKGACREAVENNSDVKYLNQLIAQKENTAQLYSSSNSKAAEEILFRNKSGQGDLELISSLTTMSLIDPVSKKTMTNPVRHTKCGHVYDRDSILIMMKQKDKVKCPYMGCVCRDSIKEKNLELALDYVQEIRRRNENR